MSEGLIVRFNRSGNRSNDHAERTIKMRPMQNRSIAGGEGLSSSLRSRSAGSPNDWKNASGAMTYGVQTVNRVGNRSGNRSGIFGGSRDPHVYRVVNRSFGTPLEEANDQLPFKTWLPVREEVKWRL